MKRISPAQRRVLLLIAESVRTRGFPPTSNEIGAKVGISSAAAFGHLNALEKKGYIERDDGPRASRITAKGHRELSEITPDMAREAARRYARTHDLLSRLWVVLPQILAKGSPLIDDVRDELANFEKPLTVDLLAAVSAAAVSTPEVKS